MNDEEIKAKYGNVFKIEVDADDEGKEKVIAYLKKPDLKTLSATMSVMNSDPIKANQILLKNCLIEEISDKRITDDDEVFLGAMTTLAELIKIRHSVLKKI